MILTHHQAKAVADAMCALNNVSGKIKASFGDVATDGINVFENKGGTVSVVVVRQYEIQQAEHYLSQDAFFKAYKLA